MTSTMIGEVVDHGASTSTTGVRLGKLKFGGDDSECSLLEGRTEGNETLNNLVDTQQ